jgi:hypothetical protein
MTKNNAVNLFIIDQSGSMNPLKQATEESYQGLIQKIKQECIDIPDLHQYLNTWVFGGNTVNEKQMLCKVSQETLNDDFSLQCNGSTPLFDAIGKSCLDLESRLKSLEMTPENTLINVALFTDGEENSSQNFRQAEVKRIITRLKSDGWVFNYYGTDLSVEDMQESLSFDKGMIMQKSAKGFQEAFERHGKVSYNEKLEWLKALEEKKRGGKGL